jgi:hypothetical protein
MKLWFEGWNVNARSAFVVSADAAPTAIAAPTRAINSLAVNRLRRDSAAKDFQAGNVRNANGLQHV